MGLVSIEKRKRNQSSLSLSALRKTQQEGGCLQGRKRALTKNQICQHHDLGLPSLQNCEKKNVYCLSPPAYGILLQ